MQELYELRRILETEALRRASDHLPYEGLVALRQRTQEALTHRETGDWLELAHAADQDLHGMIADCSQNHRLRHELHRFDTMMAAMVKSVHNANDSLVGGLCEHFKIIDVLLAREFDRARALPGRHIVATAHEIEAILFAADRPERDEPACGAGGN